MFHLEDRRREGLSDGRSSKDGSRWSPGVAAAWARERRSPWRRRVPRWSPIARTADQLTATEQRASAAAGSVTGIRCDVSDLHAVERLAAQVRSGSGTPNLLVNAAGVFGPVALIKDGDPADWVRTVMIDAIAPYLTARQFVGGMLDAGWGRIVNVTSAASLHPPGRSTARTARQRWPSTSSRATSPQIAGSGVTANVIHPGDVKTDMWADIREGERDGAGGGRVSRLGPMGGGDRGGLPAEGGGPHPGAHVGCRRRPQRRVLLGGGPAPGAHPQLGQAERRVPGQGR